MCTLDPLLLLERRVKQCLYQASTEAHQVGLGGEAPSVRPPMGTGAGHWGRSDVPGRACAGHSSAPTVHQCAWGCRKGRRNPPSNATFPPQPQTEVSLPRQALYNPAGQNRAHRRLCREGSLCLPTSPSGSRPCRRGWRTLQAESNVYYLKGRQGAGRRGFRWWRWGGTRQQRLMRRGDEPRTEAWCSGHSA